MKNNLIVLLFLVLSNLVIGQNTKNNFLIRWSKVNYSQKITLLNDYIIDFNLSKGVEKENLDSNCVRSKQKKYFEISEVNEVVFYLINDVLLFGKKSTIKEKEFVFSFIIENLKLSSYDQQAQLFDSYICRYYLNNSNSKRLKLNANQILQLALIIEFLDNKKDFIYYKNQIRKLYGLNVNPSNLTLKKYHCICP